MKLIDQLLTPIPTISNVNKKVLFLFDLTHPTPGIEPGGRIRCAID